MGSEPFYDLNIEAQNLVENAFWNLGDVEFSVNDLIITSPQNFYIGERGNNVIDYEPSFWVGEMGLIYPSDYGYATSGGSTIDKNKCYELNFSSWESECYNNNYLDYGSNQWTITKIIYYEQPYIPDDVYVLSEGGTIINYYTMAPNISASPVLYPKHEALITGGDGTKNNPYTLGI